MLPVCIEYKIINQLIPHVPNLISMSIECDEVIPNTVEKALSASRCFLYLEARPSNVLVDMTAGRYTARTEVDTVIGKNSFRDRSYRYT